MLYRFIVSVDDSIELWSYSELRGWGVIYEDVYTRH